MIDIRNERDRPVACFSFLVLYPLSKKNRNLSEKARTFFARCVMIAVKPFTAGIRFKTIDQKICDE